MIDDTLEAALAKARQTSHEHFGRRIEFFLPGMFVLDGETGLYPAVSLTGGRCKLMCDHCRGRLLESMIPVLTPEILLAKARELKRRGQVGFLISGGSDDQGRLPWDDYLPAIERIVSELGLIITVHAGYIDFDTALRLKAAGVSQALVDVIGDDETARTVYHLERGAAPVWETLDALARAGLEAAPHVILGLDYGRIKGEYKALERLTAYKPTRLVTVILKPLSGTPMKGLTPPAPEECARFLIAAREVLPEVRHQLGCARPGGRHRRHMDRLAVRAGVNALALPSDEAGNEAHNLNLNTDFKKICCSLAGDIWKKTGR